MASISFGGLGNGLDFGQVVDQLVKVQRLPIDQLSQKKATAQSKRTGASGVAATAKSGARTKILIPHTS